MTEQEIKTREALGRSGLYRMLSLGFSYPSQAVRDEFNRVRGLLDQEGVTRELAPLAYGECEALVATYLTLFDRKADCTPYESEYGEGAKAFTKSRDLVDIAGFYKAFGFQLSEESGDLYDHLKVELEFMSILALKEAYARAEGMQEELEVTVGALVAFLKDHVGRWVPAFCDQLVEADGGFYGQLAGLTRGVLEQELALWQVTPQPLYRQAQGEDRDDCLTCPMAN